MSTWELFQASDICPPDFASLTPLEQSELYKRFQASRMPEPEPEPEVEPEIQPEPGSRETTEREAALDLWGDSATAEDAQSGGSATAQNERQQQTEAPAAPKTMSTSAPKTAWWRRHH